MTLSDVDRQHLEHTLLLAERGRAGARPNPVVGAVVARGAEVLSTGYHARCGDRHAERVALDALDNVPDDATLYVSLEPCSHHGRQPPCSDAIIERGIRRVVVAGADPSTKTAGVGPRRLRQAGVTVEWGDDDIAARAAQQNAGFVSVHTRRRPYVTYKWAMTRNGRFATGDPHQRWVSGEASRLWAHLMRAASGAVAVGVGTVIADDPQLTVRGEAAGGMFTPPLRVVYDRSLRIPPSAALVRTAREVPTLVITTDDAPADAGQVLTTYGVELFRAPAEPASLLEASLAELAQRGVNDLLLECGPTLATVFHDAGLIDSLSCFMAPFEAPADQPGFAADHPLVTVLQKATPVQVGDDLLWQTVLHPMPGVPRVA